MADEIRAYVAHYHPLVGCLMQEMGLVETINQEVDAADSQVIVDTGTMVAAMIQHMLGNEPIRLYRLEQFFADKPMPLVFPWFPTLTAEALNDDRAGRALDEIWAAGPQKVFSAVSREVISRYELDVSGLHLDSTSKSFQGAYENQPDPTVPLLTHGYSKDQRPDLVQLLFGMGTSRDGVVVYADVASGNTQDMVANGYWMTQVRDRLGLEAHEFLLYVADSAVVTEENLKVMRLFHQDLISRLPARFSLHDQLLAQAPLDLATWDDLGQVGQDKEAAHYKVWQTEAELAGATYRFLVLWSNKLAQQHRHTLMRQVEKEWRQVENALAEVARQQFHEASQAQTYWATFLTQHPLVYHQLTATVEPVEVALPYAKRGRPAKGTRRPTAIRYQLQVAVSAPLNAFYQACQGHGKFILITSLRDRLVYPASHILAEYKEQHTAERAFRFIKDPTWVGAFCLKKPERVAAFAYLLLMAAMVYTLLERQVRQPLQLPEATPLLGLNNRPTKQPTAYAIKTILSPILVIATFLFGQWSFRPAQPLTDNQKQVLNLAGFGEHLYQWQGELTIGNYHLASP